MLIFCGIGYTPTPINAKWVVDFHTYIPFTRGWAKITVNGVPVGTQIDWLSCKSTGKPMTLMRSDAVIQFPITQGPKFAGGTGLAQPATT
jgi:hypothetical protein